MPGYDFAQTLFMHFSKAATMPTKKRRTRKGSPKAANRPRTHDNPYENNTVTQKKRTSGNFPHESEVGQPAQLLPGNEAHTHSNHFIFKTSISIMKHLASNRLQLCTISIRTGGGIRCNGPLAQGMRPERTRTMVCESDKTGVSNLKYLEKRPSSQKPLLNRRGRRVPRRKPTVTLNQTFSR